MLWSASLCDRATASSKLALPNPLRAAAPFGEGRSRDAGGGGRRGSDFFFLVDFWGRGRIFFFFFRTGDGGSSPNVILGERKR